MSTDQREGSITSSITFWNFVAP
ncbi:Protein of unknown function [Pyronema omphalodes CBS 100304]|uniref:Uncharacterized protein n=1 Tax=Pyronema omphalodes (strain CBS 100304) TaxID=1076935 RepID=U4LGS2_PYROM|nr:Protein of unknown function [Pyronema omphalodes CBS 100304]